ncbi:MAG: serine/threonine-protein kinase [Myxococcota bacterium]
MRVGDRFELVERVGVGGSASVYRARDTRYGDEAAVKVLHPDQIDEPALVERFRIESAVLGGLHHDAIPTVRAISAADDPLLWFAQDFVEGLSLLRAVQEGMIDPVRLVESALEVCDALAYVHREGIVHRDVKPDNILVHADLGARLVDFGIAQVRHDRLTGMGSIMGTPAFMAPEQAVDPRGAEPRSDLFSLGATLFAVITRRSGLELVYEHTRDEALAALPAWIRPVVARATMARADERYDDADQMQWALAECLAEAERA